MKTLLVLLVAANVAAFHFARQAHADALFVRRYRAMLKTGAFV